MMLPLKSTREQRESPEGVEAFNEFIAILKKRTPETLKALHIIVGTQTFYCIDFDITADTLVELIERCRTAQLAPLNEAMWWQFWCAEFVGGGAARFTSATFGKVFLALRGTPNPDLRNIGLLH